MNVLQAMESRHAVRQYSDRPIEAEVLAELRAEIAACNAESGLHIQLVTDEPKAFDGFMAHYGKFSGVKNYVALIGKKGKNLDELLGYYGERIAIKAQMLGLNSCWVAMSYKKVPSAFCLEKGEKLTLVIALGYGATDGVAHKSKTVEQVCDAPADAPEWFFDGVRAALLAPTAMNQQKFKFVYSDEKVSVKPGLGFYTKVDAGIVKYHFEVGANKKIEW